MTLYHAITELTNELKADKDYYNTWKSNIAMSFYDEFKNRYPEPPLDLHEISNKAADNFLTLLCKVD